jgi:hypothetical protein
MEEFEKINNYILIKFNNLIIDKTENYMIYDEKKVDDGVNILNIIDKYIIIIENEFNMFQKILNSFKITIIEEYLENIDKISKLDFYNKKIVPYIKIIVNIYKNTYIRKKNNNECYLFINELLEYENIFIQKK